ncbi:MAG: tetratricopeptide repeat protein [Pseudomonadota bacterium]
MKPWLAPLAFALLAFTLAACASGGLVVPADERFAPGPASQDRVVSNMELGHRLMAGGEYELALRAFSRAAGEDGLTPEILMALGTANIGLGRLGQAETLLRDAERGDPTSPDINNNLAVVLMERGKVPEAAQYFRRAFALDNGQSVQIRDNLRKALAKLENPGYDDPNNEAYQLVRRGSSDYLISEFP